MDEKPDQILGHIEAQRSELGRNLNELETRVRRGTDWKTYFDRNPMMMLGVALGGGLLLGTAVGNKRKHHRGYSYSSGRSSSAALGFASAGAASSGSGSHAGSRVSSEQRQQITETMEHMKAALIGFGIAKAKEFMCQAIPGFDQHLSEAEQKRRSEHAQHGGFSAESGSGTQSQSWDKEAYSSGGRDKQGTYGNMGSSSTGETGYRGSHSAGEPVGVGTSRDVTP